MSKNIRIILAQTNPVVGDIEGNLAQARKLYQEASAAGADMIVLSELFLTGYPPEDLIMRRAFLVAAEKALAEMAGFTTGSKTALLAGAPYLSPEGNLPCNSAFLLAEGKIKARHDKILLPNYEVFDEKRRFTAGKVVQVMEHGGLKFAALVCEDIWEQAPMAEAKQAGAEMVLVLNSSPFEEGKYQDRLEVAQMRTKEAGLPLIYVNQFGGQDELVFDGASFAFDGAGVQVAQAPAWRESALLTEWEKQTGWQCRTAEQHEVEQGDAAVWQAICTGLGDYVNKNGFPGIILGLSGGIDSAACAALAVDALGAERVHCLALPSKYSSQLSLELAEQCAENLGVRLDVLSIEAGHEVLAKSVKELPQLNFSPLADENLQARLRGLYLMAVSNSTGAMVLTTGNKSELSVGYATLYGDMNGGFNPLRDIYKTRLYKLAHWRNENFIDGLLGPKGEVIPPAIISRAPSAELRPEQKDEDSLPPYPVLDDILRRLIDEEASLAEIASEGGHDADLVRRIAGLVRVAEYKRRQAAPGVKLGPRPFGKGRRYPITNRFSQ